MPRYCPNHGVVHANEDGTCSKCNPQHTINLIDPGMAILNNTYQHMASLDQRPDCPKTVYVPEGYEVKESHQCLDTCLICFCCVFLLMPAIFLSLQPFRQESMNIDIARYGLGTLSFIGLLFVLRWWYRVYKAGGVTTIEQSHNCNCTSYQYLEQNGCFLGICSSIKRVNYPSGCEFPRFVCLFVTLIFLFVAAIMFTFNFNQIKNQ